MGYRHCRGQVPQTRGGLAEFVTTDWIVHPGRTTRLAGSLGEVFLPQSGVHLELKRTLRKCSSK
jgi:hypothetical protein